MNWPLASGRRLRAAEERIRALEALNRELLDRYLRVLGVDPLTVGAEAAGGRPFEVRAQTPEAAAVEGKDPPLRTQATFESVETWANDAAKAGAIRLPGSRIRAGG